MQDHGKLYVLIHFVVHQLCVWDYIILKNKLSYFCKDSDFVPFSSLKCIKAVTTWNHWSLALVQSHRQYESVRPKLNCSVSMIERLQAEQKSPVLLTIFSRARKALLFGSSVWKTAPRRREQAETCWWCWHSAGGILLWSESTEKSLILYHNLVAYSPDMWFGSAQQNRDKWEVFLLPFQCLLSTEGLEETKYSSQENSVQSFNLNLEELRQP